MHYHHQGEVLEDRTDRCCRSDTPVVRPPLRFRFIHGYVDVSRCVHLGGEKLHLYKEGGEIQVVDHHVPLGFCVRYKYGLHLCGKWRVPDEPLAIRVLSDAPHAIS